VLLTLDKIAYDIEIKITGFNCMISIDGITLNMQFNNTAFLKYCSVHTARVHGPCSRAVNTGVILDTGEHGPSRSAGAIVNNVIIIFYLHGRVSKM